MAFATATDVATALGRALTSGESARVQPGMLDEASDVVLGYLGCDPTDTVTSTVPGPVVRVTARMVKRVLEQVAADASANAGTSANVESQSLTAGIFGQTLKYSTGATSGAPWLVKSDRIALKPYVCDAKAFAVDTAPTTHGIGYYDAPWWSGTG